MQKENVEEYFRLRLEAAAVKSCMTDYVKFLIVGVGAAVSGLGGIVAFSGEGFYWEPIVISAYSLSFIADLLLLILIYKFSSHNRYVGYCRTLARESWNGASAPHDSLVLWEVCVARLTRSDSIIRKSNLEASDIPESNQPARIGESLWFLVRAMFTQQYSASWGFPVTIVRTFAYVVALLFIGALTLVFMNCADINGWMLGISVFAVLLQFAVWTILARRFCDIMQGRDTVDAYSERFDGVRREVLKKYYDIKARYLPQPKDF